MTRDDDDQHLFRTDSDTLIRLLAALRRTPDQDRLPVDILTISRSVTQALARRLALPERMWVDTMTTRLRGHLELLMREDLGDIGTPAVRSVFRDAYALLDLAARPDADTPPFTAYEHLRALATVTRSAAALYAVRRNDGQGR